MASPSAGGIRIGDRYLTPARVAAIRRQNLARKPSPVDRLIPSARPIDAAEAERLRKAGRGSGDLDPTRTATDPAVVQKLRQEFSGPGVAGYNALKYAIGPDLAAYVPGTQPPVGFHRSPGRAALNVTELLPWERGAGAVIPAVQAFRRSGDVNAAIGAARATFRGRGPIERASIRLLPKLQAARTAGLASANPAMRVATRVAWPVPFPIPPASLRYGVPNASMRQLELMGDRALLFSGALGKPEALAEKHRERVLERRRFQKVSNQIAPYQP